MAVRNLVLRVCETGVVFLVIIPRFGLVGSRYGRAIADCRLPYTERETLPLAFRSSPRMLMYKRERGDTAASAKTALLADEHSTRAHVPQFPCHVLHRIASLKGKRK